ncbi:hypothetical protein BDZ45DRAFT_687347 [Acephala macrosclerotiorum]|nr:hypothetical protein BDZ45DRAFT_687347 [Acephala macrosclerotiorum]
MRAAFKAQNDNPLTLQYAYKNKFFPLDSVFLFTTSIFVLASTFYVSLFPIGAPTTVENFFETFLCVPLFIVLYLGYKIVYKTKFVDPAKADLQTGWKPLSESDIAFLDAYYRIAREDALSLLVFEREGWLVVQVFGAREIILRPNSTRNMSNLKSVQETNRLLQWNSADIDGAEEDNNGNWQSLP